MSAVAAVSGDLEDQHELLGVSFQIPSWSAAQQSFGDPQDIFYPQWLEANHSIQRVKLNIEFVVDEIVSGDHRDRHAANMLMRGGVGER